MSEYFGIIATSDSGSTAAMELVSGREKAAEVITGLIESGHTVRLYACKPVDFEICNTVKIFITP